MEKELTQIKLNMQEVQSDVKYIKKSLDELKAEFKSFSDQCDKKYASKLTEKIVYTMIGAIALYVLNSVFKLIGTR